MLEYGMGNPNSIINMIRKVGGEAILSSNIECLNSSSAIVLPGVGSFDNVIKKISKYNLLPILEQKILIEKTF